MVFVLRLVWVFGSILVCVCILVGYDVVCWLDIFILVGFISVVGG